MTTPGVSKRRILFTALYQEMSICRLKVFNKSMVSQSSVH